MCSLSEARLATELENIERAYPYHLVILACSRCQDNDPPSLTHASSTGPTMRMGTQMGSGRSSVGVDAARGAPVSTQVERAVHATTMTTSSLFLYGVRIGESNFFPLDSVCFALTLLHALSLSSLPSRSSSMKM